MPMVIFPAIPVNQQAGKRTLQVDFVEGKNKIKSITFVYTFPDKNYNIEM